MCEAKGGWVMGQCNPAQCNQAWGVLPKLRGASWSTTRQALAASGCWPKGGARRHGARKAAPVAEVRHPPTSHVAHPRLVGQVLEAGALKVNALLRQDGGHLVAQRRHLGAGRVDGGTRDRAAARRRRDGTASARGDAAGRACGGCRRGGDHGGVHAGRGCAVRGAESLQAAAQGGGVGGGSGKRRRVGGAAPNSPGPASDVFHPRRGDRSVQALQGDRTRCKEAPTKGNKAPAPRSALLSTSPAPPLTVYTHKRRTCAPEAASRVSA